MFFKFFKRKPKPPLVDAINMLNKAVHIAHKYQDDRNHVPSEQELLLLDVLAETLLRNYWTMERIARNLHQRSRGEPEDPKKLIDPTMFDFYYLQ